MAAIKHTILHKAVDLLTAFNISVELNDFILIHSVDAVYSEILNLTNQMCFPKPLIDLAVSRVAGRCMELMLGTGNLVIENIDLDAGVKALKMGDTTVEYTSGEGSMTGEQKVRAVISSLTAELDKAQMNRFRRLKW